MSRVRASEEERLKKQKRDVLMSLCVMCVCVCVPKGAFPVSETYHESKGRQ